MTRMRQVKTTFTAGEVSRALLGRGDLRAYENGALTLQNVFIQPTGGVTRRAGLRYIDTARGAGRLIAFEFNIEQTYLLVLSDGKLDIYADSVLVATLDAGWTTQQIPNIAWTQSADTMLLVHPELPPQTLTRNKGGVFLLDEWGFHTSDDGVRKQPYYKFADMDVTLTPDDITGDITITASAPVFVAGHEGTRLRIGNKEVIVTEFNSPTVISAQVIGELLATTPTIDWQEQAFSTLRGYPGTVAFHQGRLVLGGSRDLPNRLWFSKSGDLFNFDIGSGLDDEAIEFAILSDQVNAIRGLFSGRHLQVFTSGAEWMVTGDPLTPATVQLKRQTRIGSITGRHIPPVSVDGATLFIARNRREIREFIYTDLEQAYQSTDLALLSRHVIPFPVDQDFDAGRRLLYLVREDGKFATLTIYRAETVAAWTLHETAGDVLSVSVVGDDVYVMVMRGGVVTIEQQDESLNLDCALDGSAPTPAKGWSGLDHLEGKTVSVLADGIVHPDVLVENGAVTLNHPVSEVVIGLSYKHIIEPLPPVIAGEGGGSRAIRLVEAIFRVEETASLGLDVGRGLRTIPLGKAAEGHIVMGAPPPSVSGDIRIRAFGWHAGGERPLWRIEQSLPLPFTLLSVTTELKVND